MTKREKEEEKEKRLNSIKHAVDSFLSDYIDTLDAPSIQGRLINALDTDFLKESVTVDSELGTGSFGMAFGLSDGTVLKLTTDIDETFAAKFLVTKKFKHENVVKFFDAVGAAPLKDETFRRIDDGSVVPFIGLVISERVAGTAEGEPGEYDLNRTRNKVWKKYNFYNRIASMKLSERRKFSKIVMKDFIDELGLRIDEIAEQVEEEEFESVHAIREMQAGPRGYYEETPPLLLDVHAGVQALYDIGLYAADFHSKNVGPGMDGGFKIFDIGVSSIPTASRRRLTRSTYSKNPPGWFSTGIVPIAEMNALEYFE